MQQNLFYFAYGSNLLFARLHARCPSIVNVGTAILSGHKLSFDKPGGDGSGKCGIEKTGVDGYVIGVLYEMDAMEKPVLDKIEGLGHGYEHKDVTVEIDNRPVDAFTYYPTRLDCALPPYDWYKNFVLQGARENNFPASYIQTIESVTSVMDSNADRRQENFDIAGTLLFSGG